MEPMSQQCHTYGLAFWMPFFGTGTSAMDSYSLRSQMCPHFTACFDMRRRDLPFAEARRLLAQWKTDIAPNYFGDFHPLTPYSTAQDVWLAWQFNRPEEGKGVVQAFRRSHSFYEAARFTLRGLDTKARYAVKNLDDPDKKPPTMSGAELMTLGLIIALGERASTAVWTYERLGQ
jgi:alpha-galactosidase